MEKVISQTGLPDCKITKALVQKIEDKKDCDLSFIYLLDELRKIISDEISRINLLFPEYTPHDEKYHLKKLFYIADELLGDDIIENMNLIELFVFSVSLYAHDWGMAISEDEKEYILKGGDDSCPFILLEDEKVKFNKFCSNNKVKANEIELAEWQDYIRQTHAFRSGCRVRNYFEKHNSGIAEVTARLCEGHYLDFEIIDDYKSYPTDYSLLRETVNIKALALYLRLVDLLDLGEDRTPYVLWKFVAPKNKFSKMEWSKHRALQPVSFPRYQTGRYIQVDGGTSDHNVYMAIMDLKRYVNDQFKTSSDILNRMNHNYHKLDLSHIDWRIAARGFKPIPIQFEFDRFRMFEILGDEIYQNDGYVFIRELIQNSIDAIRVRKEIIENKGLEFNNGRVIVDIVDFNDLYYKLTFSDNGIGMDEYIVRNYLSVAGKSYYTSKDYEKEGFKMEPISRFGIGVLSCFMLSDYLEITTYRDPYTSTSASEKLKITIPAKENYFRVETIHDSLDVGTTFNVYILKDKLIEHEITQINIKEYIKEIAGFVDFPIEVNENLEKTVIIRPNQTTKEETKNFHSLSYSFPFEKAILPQNISIAKKFFSEKKILLKDDLKLKEFEGCITYLHPIDDKLDIINIGQQWPINDVKLIHLEKELTDDDRIQWNDSWIDYGRGRYSERKKVLSIRKQDAYSVYLNGILLPNVSPPEINQKSKSRTLRSYSSDYLMDCFLVPQLIVNVPASTKIKIDLARTTISDDENWDKPIWEALFHYIKETEFDSIMEKDAKTQYFHIGRLKTFYRLTDKIIFQKIISDIKQIPIPLFSPKNQLEFINLEGKNKNKKLILPCKMVQKELRSFVFSTFFADVKSYNGFLNSRSGGDLLAIGDKYHEREISSSLHNMNNLIYSLLNSYYTLSKIEFITSPIGSEYPWVNEVYSYTDKKTELNLETEISKIKLDHESYHQNELLKYKLNLLYRRVPKVVSFDKPFEDKLFFSWEYINRDHAFTRHFMEVLFKVAIASEEKKIPRERIGLLIDKINQLSFMKSDYYAKQSNLASQNEILHDIINLCSDLSIINKESLIITKEDFVSNSISFIDDVIEIIDYEDLPITQEKWGVTII